MSIKPDQPYGDSHFLYVGSDGSGTKRTYLLFDVSTIPFDGKVTSGTLRLYYDHMVDPASVSVSTHKATALWNQAQLTWNNQPTYDPTSESTNSSFKRFRSSDDSEYSDKWPELEILYTTP